MTVAVRVKEYLERQGVPFTLLAHPEAFTAREAASAAHVPGTQVAKVLVGRDESGFVMAVLPASCHLDVPAFRDLTSRRHLVLATERELMELFPDCEVGAMPPFGRLYGLPVYADACFAKAGEIVIPAGNHREHVRILWSDFVRAAKPVVMDFCRP
jgi:Ala-tRNA(Pro) deacylase